jgi:hypothetical protein
MSNHLLSLLRRTLLTLRVDILPQVCSIHRSLPNTLGALPTRPDRRRNVRALDLLIDMGRSTGESILNELALREACSEEDSVDTQQDPAAFAKGDGGQEEADPQEDFEAGNRKHSAVIVVLDELADRVGRGALGFWSAGRGGSSASWGGFWRGDGRDQVGAGVGCDMEDAVDGEWEEGEWSLSGVEPDEADHCLTRY